MNDRERKEKEILEHIKLAIELYNEISVNKVELVEKKEHKKTQRGNRGDTTSETLYGEKATIIPISTEEKNAQVAGEEEQNVGNYFVCAYDGKTGLFEQTNWIDKECNNFVSIYNGVGVEKIGIWKSIGTVFGTKEQWLKNGEVISFRKSKCTQGQCMATCDMYQAMTFEDMRGIMRRAGKISGYRLGRASRDEIQEVLDFATIYFHKELEKPKTKSFSKFPRR